MYLYKRCPDCLRSDDHHPLCPSEDLPLEGQFERDEIDAFKEERDRRLSERDPKF